MKANEGEGGHGGNGSGVMVICGGEVVRQGSIVSLEGMGNVVGMMVKGICVGKEVERGTGVSVEVEKGNDAYKVQEKASVVGKVREKVIGVDTVKVKETFVDSSAGTVTVSSPTEVGNGVWAVAFPDSSGVM